MHLLSVVPLFPSLSQHPSEWHVIFLNAFTKHGHAAKSADGLFSNSYQCETISIRTIKLIDYPNTIVYI